jgi:hypothetical protein
VTCLADRYVTLKRRAALALLALFLIFPHQKSAMAGDRLSVIGWIEIQPVAGRHGHLTIRGHVHGLEARRGTFELRVTRASNGNNSATKQAGTFDVRAGDSAALSATTVNVQANDQVDVELTLFADGAEIFLARLQSP